MMFEKVVRVEKCPEIGMNNILRSHVFIDLIWPISFEFLHMKYDGLPLVSIGLGVVRFGWGQTHEWVDNT